MLLPSTDQGVVKAVEQAAEAAIKAKGSFTLVLSGGSLPSLLSGLVAKKVRLIIFVPVAPRSVHICDEGVRAVRMFWVLCHLQLAYCSLR